MSSLAQLADLLTDAPLMARGPFVLLARSLGNPRRTRVWVIESSAPDSPPDRGEANNTGDILETALILGRWGYTEAYDDAERILRGHLLPSQLRDISWIEGPANSDRRGRGAATWRSGIGAPLDSRRPTGTTPSDCRVSRSTWTLWAGAVAVTVRGVPRGDAPGRLGTLGQHAVRPRD